jgi:hypothetical protein
MNIDVSFKDYSELYKWASEGKPIYFCSVVYRPDSHGRLTNSVRGTISLDESLIKYSKVFEK